MARCGPAVAGAHHGRRDPLNDVLNVPLNVPLNDVFDDLFDDVFDDAFQPGAALGPVGPGFVQRPLEHLQALQQIEGRITVGSQPGTALKTA